MPEPDVEKKRKKRRRSARFYISTAHPLPSPEQIAALASLFPSDPGDDDEPAPQHSAARASVGKRNFDPDVGGGVDRDKIPAKDFAGRNRSFPIVTRDDVSDALQSIGRAGEDNYDAATLRRRILAIARRKGFDVPAEKAMAAAPADALGAAYANHRVSEPLAQGHASPSAADHGVGAGRSEVLAAWHGNLQQQPRSLLAEALTRLTTAPAEDASREITWTPGTANVVRFDAAGAAGRYHGMQPAGGNPQRPDWHQSRGSATGPNGSHGLDDAASAPRQSMKGLSRMEIMKRTQRPMYGGGR